MFHRERERDAPSFLTLVAAAFPLSLSSNYPDRAETALTDTQTHPSNAHQHLSSDTLVQHVCHPPIVDAAALRTTAPHVLAGAAGCPVTVHCGHTNIFTSCWCCWCWCWCWCCCAVGVVSAVSAVVAVAVAVMRNAMAAQGRRPVDRHTRLRRIQGRRARGVCHPKTPC